MVLRVGLTFQEDLDIGARTKLYARFIHFIGQTNVALSHAHFDVLQTQSTLEMLSALLQAEPALVFAPAHDRVVQDRVVQDRLSYFLAWVK